MHMCIYICEHNTHKEGDGGGERERESVCVDMYAYMCKNTCACIYICRERYIYIVIRFFLYSFSSRIRVSEEFPKQTLASMAVSHAAGYNE